MMFGSDGQRVRACVATRDAPQKMGGSRGGRLLEVGQTTGIDQYNCASGAG